MLSLAVQDPQDPKPKAAKPGAELFADLIPASRAPTAGSASDLFADLVPGAPTTVPLRLKPVVVGMTPPPSPEPPVTTAPAVTEPSPSAGHASDRIRNAYLRMREGNASFQREMATMDSTRRANSPGFTEDLNAIAVDPTRGRVTRGMAAGGALLTGMIEHPIDTYEGLVKAPLESGRKLLRYLAQQPGNELVPNEALLAKFGELPKPDQKATLALLDAFRPDGAEREISDHEAKFAALQVAAVGAARPMGRIARAMMQGAKVPEIVGSRAAGALAHVPSGAAIGAAYDREDPARGAVAGATVGVAIGAAAGDKLLGKQLRTTNPERMIGGEPPPPPPPSAAAGSAKIVEPTPPSSGPDFTVEDAQVAPKPSAKTKVEMTDRATTIKDMAAEGRARAQADAERLVAHPDHAVAPEPAAEVFADLVPKAKTEPIEKTVAASKEPDREFSSTQLDLPDEPAKAVKAAAAKIPDADLAPDGREDRPHITVKFGLHGNEPEKVRALLKDEGPITVTLGKTSIFPASESGSGDVVKVDVDSPALHALNKKIADALPNTDTHPEYKPHVTLAYVKKGLGAKYVDDASLEGQTITIDKLTFAGKDRTEVAIPLSGTKAAPEAKAAKLAVPAADATLPNASEARTTPASAQSAGSSGHESAGVRQRLAGPKDAPGKGDAATERRGTVRPAQAAPPRALADRPVVAGAEGRASEVFFSSGKRVKTTYRVVDAHDLQASHDPAAGFEPNPHYPEGVQGRAYHGKHGTAARQQVELATGTMRPEVVLDTGAGVTDGPPLVTPHGVVVAGNQRAMMLKGAASQHPETFAKYRAELSKRAKDFGVSPEAIAGMKSPVLIRQLADESIDTNNIEQLASLNQLSDQTATKTKDQVSDAMSRAKVMRSATSAINHLAATMDPNESLADYFGGPDGRELVRTLAKDGVISTQELPKFVSATTGVITDEGKSTLEDMLYAAAIGDGDVMAKMPKWVRTKIKQSIPSLIATGEVGVYSLQPDVQQAITLLFNVEARKSERRREKLYGLLRDNIPNTEYGVAHFLAEEAGKPDDIFAGQAWDSKSPGVRLAQFIEAKSSVEVAEAMRSYAKGALVANGRAQSEDLFGEEPATPDALRRDIFQWQQRVAESVPSYGDKLPFAKENFAAVRLPDGQVFRASDHIEAYALARATLPKGTTPAQLGYEDGFILRDGSFVTREQATKIFKDARQRLSRDRSEFRGIAPDELHARDLKDHEDFQSGGGGDVVDDVSAKRVKMPKDLQDDVNLLGEERAWMRAVTTPGARVLIGGPRESRLHAGAALVPGKIIRGAEDPVNGLGHKGMALVEHQMEGAVVQRWYQVLDLTPVGPGGASVVKEKGQKYSPDQLTLKMEDGTEKKASELPAEEKTAFTPDDADVVKGLVAKVAELGLPESGARRAEIEAASKRGLIDVRGRSMKTPRDAGFIMQAFRHPAMEMMHAFLLSKSGKVLEHVAMTSGIVDSVVIPTGWGHWLGRRAKEIGATRVVLGHNHPSGDPSPSTDDVAVTAEAADHLQAAGLTLDGHVVINHESASWIRLEPGMSKTFFHEHVTLPPAESEWRTAPQMGSAFARSPSAVAQLTAAVVSPKAIVVVYLDSQRRVIAVEPRVAGDAESLDWIDAARQSHAAEAVMLVVPEDRYEQTAHAIRDGQQNGEPGSIRVLDVIGLPTDVAGHGTLGRYTSATESRVLSGGHSDDGNPVYPVAVPGASASDQLADARRRQLDTGEAGRGGEDSGVRENDRVTDGPAFRRWFGDSKVVDETGQPLRVYHGTIESFDRFAKNHTGVRMGNKYGRTARGAGVFFFTDNVRVASDYATAHDDLGAGHPSDRPNVMPVYLSLQSPLVINGDGGSWALFQDDIADARRSAEYDGVILRNVRDHARIPTDNEVGGVDVFVAFEPTQIKSATGNRGTFDPNSSSIVREDAADYATGIKNDTSAAERERLGLGERVAPEPRTQEEMYDAGKALDAADPGAMDRLLKALQNDPERIVGTKEEAGLLLKHRVDLDRHLRDLIAATDKALAAGDVVGEADLRLQLAAHRDVLRDFIQLVERTGTATGRALSARRMMSKLDYSLSNMESLAEAAKGSPLTDDELSQVGTFFNEMQVRLASVQADLAGANERAAIAEADLHHAQLRAEAMAPLTDRVAKRLESAGEAAKARIRARGLRASAGLDPTELADYALLGATEIARGAVRFADWSAKMTASFGDYVKPHLQEIFAAANAKLNTELEAERETQKASDKAPRREKTGAGRTPSDVRRRMQARIDRGIDSLADLRAYLRVLALDHIRHGVTSREKLLDALFDDVRAAGLDDLDRTEVRDALSGYGQFQPLDMAADKARLREIQAELQKLAQLEALQRGQSPRASGFERQAPSDEVRRLTQQVNEAKKKAGIKTGMDDAGRLKSALAAAKTRTRNAIKDLQSEIDTGTRIVAGKSTLVSDPELDVLRAQLADLRKIEAEVFTAPELTDAERLARAIAGAQRNAARWSDRLAKARSGVFGKPRAQQLGDSPSLAALRAKAKAAREEYNELRSLDPAQQKAATDKANQQYRARLAQQELDLLDRIARKDFVPRPKRIGTQLDPESLRRRTEVESVKRRWKQQLDAWELANRTPWQRVRDAVAAAPGAAKSLKASLDISALFRQGLRPMITHPRVWLHNSLQSFRDVAQTFGGKEVMDAVRADLGSRANASLYQRAKLAISTQEEAFPSSLPERIPVLGRAFKASEVAFTAFQYRMRADVFDQYIRIARVAGVDVNDKAQLQSIGKLVNSLTSRAHLGRMELAANVVNDLFFSPRALKSHLDVLTAHATDPSFSSFARRQAAINLVKIVAAMAAIMAIANALRPGSAETDPRSSDFGRIKVRNTRFDFSGGIRSLVTLAARLLTMSSKSSTTGRVTKINRGKFGAQSGTDVLYQFFENKLSPTSAVVLDVLRNKTFSGEKPTVLNEASNLLTPMSVSNAIEILNSPNGANPLAVILADAVGIGTQTYGKRLRRPAGR